MASSLTVFKMTVVIFCFLLFHGCKSEKKPELVLFCAAGLKVPITQIAAEYEKDAGVGVRIHFAGSGTLLSSLKVVPSDLYLAADSTYIEAAKGFGLLTDIFRVAQMTAGLGVAKGNPKQLDSIQGLVNSKLRYAVGNPEAASIGRYTKEILTEANVWHQMKPKATFPTVNEIVNAIELNSIDAGIVWDAVAFQYDNVDFIPLAEFAGRNVQVSIAVTQKTEDRDSAIDFCRYLASRKGRDIFRQSGYAQPE